VAHQQLVNDRAIKLVERNADAGFASDRRRFAWATTGTTFQPVSRNGMDSARLKAEADRCRFLASSLSNQSTIDMLNRMADEFEQAAIEQEARFLFSEKEPKRDS
jgi:hypothetical protein